MFNKLFLASLVISAFIYGGWANAQTPASSSPGLKIAAWVPYWSQGKGIPTLLSHLEAFDAISPFAYEVDDNGHLIDRLGMSSTTWLRVIASARQKGIEVVPSILWNKKTAMHDVLGDPIMRSRHISEIIGLVQDKGYDGIEIDYEGKAYEDKAAFSLFLNELGKGLDPNGKKLICTIEARSSDSFVKGILARLLFPWANDYAVVNGACDEVRIMAYDEFFMINGKSTFTTYEPVSESVSNSSIGFVENVLKYTTSRIDKSKVVLGIPTYGYEFSVEIIGQQRNVKRVRSHSYAQAMALSKSVRAKVYETKGKEKYFIYVTNQGQTRYVVFSDSQTIAGRMALAKKYGIKGVSLFKVDGGEDEKLWKAIGSI